MFNFSFLKSDNDGESKRDELTYDLLVIGGGASGMMAAAVASAKGQTVVVIEQNSELGKKLKITGGGRCNILNAEFDTKILLTHYGEAAKFLHSAFAIFDVEKTINYFSDIGIEIKIEDKKRAFPKSEKAIDVYDAIQSELDDHEVDILTDHKVTKINIDDLDAVVNIEATNTKTGVKGLYKAKRYLIATGGMSHAETGSTGDGFKFLKDLGYTITTPTPDLVPIQVSTSWVTALTGRTLKDVKVTFYVDGVKSLVVQGKDAEPANVLCTHFGMSGPSIINSSRAVSDMMGEGEVTGTIDLFKSMDIGTLDTYILNVFDQNKNKKLRNVLNDIYPENVLEIILSNLNIIDLDQEVNNVSREGRRAIIDIVKGLEFKVDGLMGIDKAIVTDGGLALDQIDFHTMRLIRSDNLYVTGDVLDIPRPSGGYSLQLCWTTGYIAGSSI